MKNNQRNTLHCNSLMLKYLTVFSKANSFGCPDITPFSLCESMCKWTKTEGNRMKTVIPSLYIRPLKKHWREITIPYVKFFFFFLKDNVQKKKHLKKIQNSWINTLKGTHISTLTKYIWKSYPHLAGLKQHTGLPFEKHSFRSNSSNPIGRSGMKHRSWPQGSRGWWNFTFVKLFLRHQLLPRGSESLK